MSSLKPHELVAHQFMKHKGYPDAEPYDIEKLDDQPCWYFIYRLPEGILELEVFWNGSDWETQVTTFTLAG
jgi:hypothetical protein